MPSLNKLQANPRPTPSSSQQAQDYHQIKAHRQAKLRTTNQPTNQIRAIGQPSNSQLPPKHTEKARPSGPKKPHGLRPHGAPKLEYLLLDVHKGKPKEQDGSSSFRYPQKSAPNRPKETAHPSEWTVEAQLRRNASQIMKRFPRSSLKEKL